MFRKSIRVALFFLLVFSSTASVGAAPSRQPSVTIVNFATPATSVSHADLRSRAARIPVSWTVVNRPGNTNLVFEQILPDGRAINVELPRDFTLVSSSGDGIVAPLDPGEHIDHIRIQVRLIDLNNADVFAQADFSLPITDTTAYRSRIRFFSAARTMVGRSELANNVIIPVSWGVDDYASNMNLVFEQILPDGQVITVELPRDFVLVPPHGEGFVAPQLPGTNTDTITLQVRLVDLPPGTRVYDRHELQLTITDTPPPSAAAQIKTFIADATNVPVNQLTAGQARISLSWSVINRPPNTNLVFEQVFPDGTAQNVELPRDFVIVASEGEGVVAPVLPDNSNRVQLRLRLVSLADSQTITSAEIILPIFTPPSDLSDVRMARGAECLDSPYKPSNGIENAESARVSSQSNVNLFDAPLGGAIIGELAPGETVTVVDPVPACWQMPAASNNQTEYRLWHVRADQLDGWVSEYSRNLLGTFYNIEPLDAASAS